MDPLEPWSRGAMEPWSHGAMEPWSHGAVHALLCSSRSMARRGALPPENAGKQCQTDGTDGPPPPQHNSPSSNNLMSLAAWMPSSFRFFSICLLRALEARSSADMAQPMMTAWSGCRASLLYLPHHLPHATGALPALATAKMAPESGPRALPPAAPAQPSTSHVPPRPSATPAPPPTARLSLRPQKAPPGRSHRSEGGVGGGGGGDQLLLAPPSGSPGSLVARLAVANGSILKTAKLNCLKFIFV